MSLFFEHQSSDHLKRVNQGASSKQTDAGQVIPRAPFLDIDALFKRAWNDSGNQRCWQEEMGFIRCSNGGNITGDDFLEEVLECLHELRERLVRELVFAQEQQESPRQINVGGA